MSLVTQRERLIGLARQWINSASDFEPAVCDTYILCAKEILKTFGQTIPHIDVPERTHAKVKKTFALPSIEYVAKRMWISQSGSKNIGPAEPLYIPPNERKQFTELATLAVMAMREQCESESAGGPGAMPQTPTPPPHTAPTPQPKEHRQSYYGDGLQPWDLIKSLGIGAAFAAGNVIKYVGRYDKKNGLDDLRKARWYIDRLIEIVESTATGSTVGESTVGGSK